MDAAITLWRKSLRNLLNYYESKRGRLHFFFPKLFVFFILLNITCYWLAMITAFSGIAFGPRWFHYFLTQFPVGILGALFDSLSFFVTVFIIRRALKSKSGLSYIGHLSIDLVIAGLASLWVVLVFSFSGWLIHLIEARPESFSGRNLAYEGKVTSAVANPTENLRNIYFGLVMGLSSMLPTCVHLYLSIRSLAKSILQPRRV